MLVGVLERFLIVVVGQQRMEQGDGSFPALLQGLGSQFRVARGREPSSGVDLLRVARTADVERAGSSGRRSPDLIRANLGQSRPRSA